MDPQEVEKIRLDLLGGPPPAEPSDEPDYKAGGGVRIGSTRDDLLMDNLKAKLNRLEVQIEVMAHELRRLARSELELKSRVTRIESQFGLAPQMSI